MKLHNTLTKSLEELKPISPPQVSLYTCGPTVYDRAHIGNLRTYIFEDTLRRTLKAGGYQVKHVMNITDIDDKTIARSRKDYPTEEPMEALRKLGAKYEQAFLEDAKKVGIDLTDSKVVRATDEIDAMKDLIKSIPNKYLSEDGVYFDIEKYPDYGAFMKLDRSHTHHRIANDEYDKEHVADFALWKTKKEGEPSWDFEIEGQSVTGRPGWHIECSAIAGKFLDQPFDIHTGGIDLVFPHHENEVAQTRAATGKDLATLFLHGQHLLVDGKKMSKSLNNFHTLDDIENGGYDPLAFRLLVLQAHYRSQMNFTWDSLDAAGQRLRTYRALADLKHQLEPGSADSANSFEVVVGEMREKLADDLNTTLALPILDAFTDDVIDRGISSANAQNFSNLLTRLDELLGLQLSTRADIETEQKRVISEREKAREGRDWQKSDELREQLRGQGIEINDTPRGPIWSRFK